QRQRCQQQQQQPTPRACSQQSPQVKSQLGAGGIFDCGANAVYYQPDLPKVYTAGMAYACGRCGRHGHNATYCAAPKRFEGHCWTCGEYGHTSRFCAVKRGHGVLLSRRVTAVHGASNTDDDGREYV
ncbi:unnamed protein product, partial [Pylaiella littoralis]